MSLADLLLPGPSCLRLSQLSTANDHITLGLTATRDKVAYPACSSLSSHIHGYYQRTVADLPWASVPVQLPLHVRRFVSVNTSCPRRTFSEPLPEVVAPSARRSRRLANEQRLLGLQVAANGAARVARRQGMPVSPTTLLRLVRTTPLPPRPTPKHLGVDEWAFGKGQDFKTILVDLDTNRPIDLLPDASATTLTTWLQEHRGVELIAVIELAPMPKQPVRALLMPSKSLIAST